MSQNSNPIKAIVEGIVLLLIAALVVWVVFYRESFTDKVNQIVGGSNTEEGSESENEMENFETAFEVPIDLTDEERAAIEEEVGPPTPLDYSQEEYKFKFTVPIGLEVEERVYFANAGESLPNHIVEMRQPDDIDVVVQLATYEDDGSGLTPQISNYLETQEISFAVSDIQSGVINKAMGEARSFIDDSETFWFFFHPDTGNFHVFRHRSDLEDIQLLVDELVGSLDTL